MEPTNMVNGQGMNNNPMQGNSMPVNQMPGVPAKKKMSKLLVIGLPVALVSVLLIGLILFFVLRGGKTSNEVLTSFSSATSTLNTKSSKLSSEISRSSYSDSADIESAKKDFDSALGEFDSAATKLKSDRKDLKSAAENYSGAFKQYRDGVVSVATEYMAVNKVAKKLSDIKPDSSALSSGNESEMLAEIDRVKKEYTDLASEIRGVNITNQKVKELRDEYAAIVDKFAGAMGKLSSAVEARDSQAIREVQSDMNDLKSSTDISSKEKAVKSLLSVDDATYKKVEDARKALNNQIDMVNSKR